LQIENELKQRKLRGKGKKKKQQRRKDN
jgi:hypothetical protein